MLNIFIGDNPFPGFKETSDVNFYSTVEQIPSLPSLNKVDEVVDTEEALKIIRANKVDFPYRRHQFDDLKVNLCFSDLKTKKVEWSRDKYSIREQSFKGTVFPHEFVRPIKNRDGSITYQRPNYLYDKFSLSLDSTANSLTDYFTEPARVKSRRSTSKYSPYDAWLKDDSYLRNIINHAKLLGKIDPYTLREGVYSQGKLYSECANARPTFILALYRLFLNGVNYPYIFDPCAGHGDRLLAAIAYGNCKYYGVDPNSNAHPGFLEMRKRFNSGDKMIANDYMPTAKHEVNYDLTFMSPPSYDSEVYSDDPGQSINLFKSRDEWLIGFLFKTIDVVWEGLKVNGYYLIQSILANEINSYIRLSKPDALFLGAVSVLTGCGRYKPIWIWTKKVGQFSQLLDIPSREDCMKSFSPELIESTFKEAKVEDLPKADEVLNQMSGNQVGGNQTSRNQVGESIISSQSQVPSQIPSQSQVPSQIPSRISTLPPLEPIELTRGSILPNRQSMNQVVRGSILPNRPSMIQSPPVQSPVIKPLEHVPIFARSSPLRPGIPEQLPPPPRAQLTTLRPAMDEAPVQTYYSPGINQQPIQQLNTGYQPVNNMGTPYPITRTDVISRIPLSSFIDASRQFGPTYK